MIDGLKMLHMKFILLTGPPAVGKMTVGRHLADKTGLKLFHNHMSLELAYHFFDFGTPELKPFDLKYLKRLLKVS